MKPRPALTAPPGNDDEVARQRRKRADALLDRPVAGFDELTLRDVLISVLAATEESADHFDVERFLVERGHAWQTVEMVLASFEWIDRHPSSPRSGPDRIEGAPSPPHPFPFSATSRDDIGGDDDR
jgi:hypothetical protein